MVTYRELKEAIENMSLEEQTKLIVSAFLDVDLLNVKKIIVEDSDNGPFPKGTPILVIE